MFEKIPSTPDTSNLFDVLNKSRFVKGDEWLTQRISFYASCKTPWTALVAAGGAFRWSGASDYVGYSKSHLVTSLTKDIDAITFAMKDAWLDAEEVKALIRNKSVDFIFRADHIMFSFRTAGADRPGWRAAATTLLVEREELEAALTAYSHMAPKGEYLNEDDPAVMAVRMADNHAMNISMVADLLCDASLTDAKQEEALKRPAAFDPDPWWLEAASPY